MYGNYLGFSYERLYLMQSGKLFFSVRELIARQLHRKRPIVKKQCMVWLKGK
jgi:hypothetical protein